MNKRSLPQVLAFLLFSISTAFAQSHPVVFINGDSGTVSTSAFAVPFAASATSSKDDKTAEMARVMLKSCPEVSLTMDKDATSDYVMLLADKGHQVLLLRGDESVIFASKSGYTSQVTKQGCKAIVADWQTRNAQASRWNTEKPKPTK